MCRNGQLEANQIRLLRSVNFFLVLQSVLPDSFLLLPTFSKLQCEWGEDPQITCIGKHLRPAVAVDVDRLPHPGITVHVSHCCAHLRFGLQQPRDHLHQICKTHRQLAATSSNEVGWTFPVNKATSAEKVED